MRYKGGKNGSGVFQRLICMMPPHRLYVEAFAGSAAVLRRKRPAERSVAYELNRATVAELAKHLPADRFEPWEINSEWNYPGDLPGSGGTSIGFNHPGTDKTALEIFNVDAFPSLERMFTAGASSWVYAWFEPRDVLVYMDPPYPDAVRSSPGSIYEFELMAEQEHSELLDLARSMPCRVMLSGYDNELYNRALKGWRKESIPTTNRAGKKVIETVWLNFPVPVELHDATHVGHDYRQRWNITKRVRNWTGQLEKMSPGTRQAIVEALNANMSAFLDEGRKPDVVAMNKIAAAARSANKKRKPITPRPALLQTDVPLFELD